MKNFFIVFSFLFSISFPSQSFAAYPGQCTITVYAKSGGPFHVTTGSNITTTVNVDTSVGDIITNIAYTPGPYDYNIYIVGLYYFDNGGWILKKSVQVNMIATPPGYQISTVSTAAVLAAYPTCPNPCFDKQGQSNYKVIQHNVGETYSAQTDCYEGCQQSTESLWEDCINSSCVSSVKYTYTGQTCTETPGLTNVTPTPPTRCTEQLQDIITQCGGSLKVQSFDFET